MRLLAIDPGVRTGVAFLEVSDSDAPVLSSHEEVYGGISGFRDWWKQGHDYDVLICEDFILRPGVHGVNTEPLRIIGFLSQFEPVMQPPAGRLASVSDAVLKRLGLYLPGEPLRNAREAVRHAVWYLKKQGHAPTLVAGWAMQPRK